MPKKVIVFEDLVSAGYEVVRDRTLNEKEVKAAYAMLAKWHAISYKINLEVLLILENLQRLIKYIFQFICRSRSILTNFRGAYSTCPT